MQEAAVTGVKTNLAVRRRLDGGGDLHAIGDLEYEYGGSFDSTDVRLHRTPGIAAGADRPLSLGCGSVPASLK